MGPFAFLPIHAAGMYNIEEPDCVIDYVILSYTPTIRAFCAVYPSNPVNMIVVVQPELPHTVEELERIEARVPVINA